MNTTLDLSIVTISDNQLFLIKKCVKSLYSLQSRASFELVVVDNACSDGTGAWINQHYPQIKVIYNTKRKGYSENGNAGIQAQQNGRYVLMLNPDIECLPGLLDKLVEFMDAHPDVGIAGPKLFNPDMTVQPSCRKFSTPLALLIRGLHLDGMLGKSRVMSSYLMTDFDHNVTTEVDWVTGALMIIRRDTIAQVGLMDERYVLYSDDQDWCCSTWRAGWRVCYVPEAQAVHLHMREGMRKPWSRAARIQVISALQMFQKFHWRLTRDKS